MESSTVKAEHDSSSLTGTLDKVKNEVLSMCRTVSEFCLPLDYFHGGVTDNLDSNEDMVTDSDRNEDTNTITDSGQSGLQGAICEFKEHVIAMSETVTEFCVPVAFFNEEKDVRTVSDDELRQSIDHVLEVLSTYRKEVMTVSSTVSDFELPSDYFRRFQRTKQSSSTYGEQGSTGINVCEYPSVNDEQHNAQTERFEQSDTCGAGLISLASNIHCNCTNILQLPGGSEICGCSFSLNELTCDNHEQQCNFQQLSSGKKRNKRRRTLTSRRRHEKDKQRKRLERQQRTNNSTNLDIGVSGAASDNILSSDEIVHWGDLSHTGTLKDALRKEKKRLSEKERYRTDKQFREKKIAKVKYRTDEQFRQKKIGKEKERYRTNDQYRQKKIGKERYHTDKQFKEKKIAKQKHRYQTLSEYRHKKISAVKQKYRSNEEHRQTCKNMSVQKYKENIHHCNAVRRASSTKYHQNRHFQAVVKKENKLKYWNNYVHRQRLKELNWLRYRTNATTRKKDKERLKVQYQRNSNVRKRKIEKAKENRENRRSTSEMSDFFKTAVKDGPLYVCCVCHKFKFRKQVLGCSIELYQRKGRRSLEMAEKCISTKYQISCTSECSENCEVLNHQKLWICYTCHRKLLEGNMPADAEANNLQLKPIPEELKHMNKLERQLVSIRIPFMKLVSLPKGAQKGIVGPCVSVPTDIESTTKVLPRSDEESQVIRVKLKRKLMYKGHQQYEFISTDRVRKGLEYLQQHNKFYTDITLHSSWQSPVTKDVAELASDGIVHAVPTESSPGEATNEDEKTENQDEDPLLKDRGMPSDTCLQPVDIGQEVLDQYFDDIFCIAPGEGNTPVSMLREEGNEAMSFPVQFPDGSTGTYNAARPVNLTRSRYFHARLFNADDRFSSDSAYVFYAQYLAELEQVISKVSIALRKTTATDRSGQKITAEALTNQDGLKHVLKTDQGYKFMTPIRGTPPYWQATLNDLMAMIRQLGIPTWFCTFSAADMRWTEILQVLLQQQGSTRQVSELDYNEKCALLKNNPIMTAVLFDHRFHTFLKEIIINRQVIGKVKDHFHRIEFQQRGSPHAHCLFWVEDAPLLDTHDDKSVCDFVDRYVSCTLPDENGDPELHDIASSVQQHSKSHSKSCKKKGTTCRFNFPRPPSERTFVCRTQSLTDPAEEQSPQQLKCEAQTVLRTLWEVMKQIPMETVSTQDLFNAAGITQQQFQKASNILAKKTSLVLQRKPIDVWVNQYNPTLLRCWNGNMDIQYVTDAYSCVMYIISYISKTEREMGLVLNQAKQEAAEGNLDAQQAMKKIGGAYFRQREVSAQEAAYRVCGLHLKESSRKVQFIPAGDNQVRMSLPLQVLQMKRQEIDDDEAWMSSLYDKYKARPLTPAFDELCYASFTSEFRVLASSQVPKDTSKPNIHKLQNGLGYIQKRTRSEAAIVRYPRFKLKKNPELYYKTNLQLFLPHRCDKQLKPENFESYEEFHASGAVAVSSTEPESVKAIVDHNKRLFEKSADDIDDAHEMIERVGPLEDAWALIGPQSEADRLESEMEREPVQHEEDMPIPELQSSSQRQHKEQRMELNASRLSGQQMKPLLQKLNSKQKQIFYKVRQWCVDKVNGQHPQPFRIYINGGAGTGKSHLIKCLFYEASRILAPHASNPDDITILLTAPTATAAFNIGGTTLHQAFSLTKSLPLPYIYKRDDDLNTLRAKLQGLEILIIDEISMVGQRLLTYVNERLRQIKQSRNALFGNVCVIAVGDFYQLPPVKQKCLFDLRPENYFPLWSCNFELVELEEIMRQKGDLQFAELLNRLRVKKKSDELHHNDVLALKECSKHSVPEETLHIFATNAEVSNHNRLMIQQICDTTQMISAQDFDKDPRTGRLTPRETPYDTTSDYLPMTLTLGPKARVMLTRNVDISIGLVNGAIGTVHNILPAIGGSVMPCAVQVIFDNERVGGSGTSNPCRPINVETIEENLNNNAVRHQFPLQLAWGCTCHKVQGMTTDTAVVSFKRIFAAGMAYVALSRVTSMNGLVIQDFDETKVYCIEQITDALQRMPQFLPMPAPQVHDQGLCIMLHNIQGLLPHQEDLIANTDLAYANIIGLTETWLKPNSEQPHLDHYNFVHSPRFSSYTNTSMMFRDLKHQQHGGVGIFSRHDQHIEHISVKPCNIEATALFVKDFQITVVIVYRPETYTASVFLEQLDQYLQLLPQTAGATLVMGDFNQDLLKSHSSVKQYMERQGFIQLVEKPTTDGRTIIDHVYLRGSLKSTVDVLPAYYSYHDIVSLHIHPQ